MSDHTAEDMKGRVKEAAGEITGDEGLQREGKTRSRPSAAAKKQIAKATDKIKEVVNPKS